MLPKNLNLGPGANQFEVAQLPPTFALAKEGNCQFSVG
jgi:hypothetical protein